MCCLIDIETKKVVDKKQSYRGCHLALYMISPSQLVTNMWWEHKELLSGILSRDSLIVILRFGNLKSYSYCNLFSLRYDTVTAANVTWLLGITALVKFPIFDYVRIRVQRLYTISISQGKLISFSANNNTTVLYTTLSTTKYKNKTF